VLAPQNRRRISSRNTFFVKRIFPLLWFGFLAVFLVATLLAFRHASRNSPPIVIIFVPLFMLGFGYLLMRRLIFDLADEVYDEGDALQVRFGHQEESIRLDNIINISYAGFTNPPRVTLTLRQPGIFGKEVTFSPIQKLFGPLLRITNPIVTDLIERVEATRQR
jgi:hypothetical protein